MSNSASHGKDKDLSSKALSAVSQLVGLQIFSRGFTFALNQVLVRVASPQVFGTATVQFELLLSTILFLAREGVRNALLRSSSSSSSRTQNHNTGSTSGSQAAKTRIANITTIPIMLGVPLALSATLLYHMSSSPSTRSQPYFSLAISFYAFAAFLELLSEPLYIRALSELKVHVRVRAEASAVAAKAVGSVLLIVLLPTEWSLLAFAGGQVAYGAATLLVFLREFLGDGELQFWAQGVKENVHGNMRTTYFDPDMLRLSMSMTGQSVFKHFLTEGDRFLVSKFSKLEDQGGYAVASNYGSLVARIGFQPVEETSRIYFSKLLSSSSSESADPTSTSPKKEKNLVEAASVAHTVLLLYTHLALIFVSFGPPYVPTILSFVLPRRYLSTSAPRVLQAYCAYLPVMALNGFLEAFMASTASPRDLVAQSRFMALCSVLFVLAAIGLSEGVGLRETGMVYANVLNLGLRAAYGWRFMRTYFATESKSGSEPDDVVARDGGNDVAFRQSNRTSPLHANQCVPPRSVWLASVAVGILVRLSSARLSAGAGIKSKAAHLGVGCVLFAGWAFICWRTERETVRQLVRFVQNRRQR